MKIKVKRFTDEFKLKVVKEYLETDISQDALKKKYGFGGSNCISNWMRKFGMKTPNEEQIKLQRIMSEEQGKTKREVELEAKIRELEKSLAYERLRTIALDTMIDVAERDLKITIRKKPGARR
jgi:transposase-like protein